MKRIPILFLLLVLSASYSFGQASKIRKTTKEVDRIYKSYDTGAGFVHKTLPNGLEVIVLPDKSVPLVTVELAVRNGSFTEPLEFNGLSHLYEHMFFKPNKAVGVFWCERYLNQRDVASFRAANCSETLKLKTSIGNVAYLGEIGKMGITYNGTTREEIVNFYYTTTSPFLDTAVKFISDAARFPEFKEEELESEKRVVIGEIDRNESNPYNYLNNAIQDKLFYKYPTRKKPLGTRETVNSATVEKMLTIKSRYYVPNNSALIVTGDVDPDYVFKLAQSALGEWERREKDPFEEFPMVEHPPLEKSEGVIVEQPVNVVLIQVGWHGPSIGKDNDATYAADVFSFILSQPDSKFQKALIDSGLAVDAQIGYYTQRNTGPIFMTIVTSPDKAKIALDRAYEQIEQFDKPGYYSDQELENSKTILEARDLFEREKLSDYAHTLGFWWSSTGIDYFRGYHQSLRNVSREDINHYVKTYIKGKPRVAAALISADGLAVSRLTEADLIGR
ncbi:MAG: insulinase family protein [Acidobacteriota bacterium]|nr:insulinase family protein [Acidobacteriota bacterium]MDH3528852.1 insulinase family protein [Acidobacteriota bacterium]